MRRIIPLMILALAFWGCATFNQSYKLGTEEAINKNWDEAVALYERATLEDPKNSVYRLALLRARFSASSSHMQKARVLVNQDKLEEAMIEYQKALEYDPDNRAAYQEVRNLAKGELRKEGPEKSTTKIEPPVKLNVTSDRLTLKFLQEISLRSIFMAMGKYSQVNMIFDESFRDRPFSIDLTDMAFSQALNNLCITTKNFYRIIDEKTVLIIPDQPQNRQKYDLLAVKTFYLSNINAQDIQQWLIQQLRAQIRVPTVTIDKNLNSVTMRDTPQKLEMAEKLIRLWDKPKGEIVVDLEIMEVTRQKMRDLGLDLDAHNVGFRYSGADTSDTGWSSLQGLDFTKSENFFLSLPTAIIKFLETEADSRMIAQPRLRGIHGEKMEYLVGDKIPIPQTTFSPIAAGGVSQQPITSFTYEKVGIDLIITPTIHLEDEVTLELELKIMTIGGTGYGDLPIISTREVKNTIRLKDGETNMLAGLLKDEERKTKKGIAGILNIPILGSLFSSTDQNILQTDVIMTITPHIIRRIPISDDDNQPLWIPLEGMSSGRGSRLPQSELSYTRPVRDNMLEPRLEPEDESGVNRLELSPRRFESPQNRNVRVNVNLTSSGEIQNMSFSVSFNPQILKLVQIDKGNVIQRLGKNPSFLENIDNNSGVCTIGFSSPQVNSGFKGRGKIVTLVFQSVKSGDSTVAISSFAANTPTGQSLHLETNDSMITIR